MHVRIKDFNCDLCEYAAFTRFDIIRHCRNIHSKIGYPSEERICPDCGKTVKGNNQLTLHIRKKHLNIKKYQCDKCPLAFYGKYELRSHCKLMTQAIIELLKFKTFFTVIHAHIPKEFKKSYPCSLCPSILSSAIGLKVHIQHKHSDLRPYSCFCGKSFSLRETLKTHIRNVHKGERKFGMISNQLHSQSL